MMAALMLVNSFGSSLVNLIFGMLVLTAQVLLVFKDDYRKEAFLLLIKGASLCAALNCRKPHLLPVVWHS